MCRRRCGTLSADDKNIKIYVPCIFKGPFLYIQLQMNNNWKGNPRNWTFLLPLYSVNLFSPLGFLPFFFVFNLFSFLNIDLIEVEQRNQTIHSFIRPSVRQPVSHFFSRFKAAPSTPVQHSRLANDTKPKPANPNPPPSNWR